MNTAQITAKILADAFASMDRKCQIEFIETFASQGFFDAIAHNEELAHDVAPLTEAFQSAVGCETV